MRIKEITYQSRRDFKAKFICPHCGYEKEDWGYDDNYFHQKVIPDMKCPKCGKTENSDYVPKQTKYPENMEIKMIKTVSIDMSTCDEDSENRIFGKVIDQEGDNLICEFDSANYDFKQENVIKQLKDKLNIALKQIGEIDNNWLPLEKLDDLDLYPVKKFIQEVECGGFIDYDGWGMPVIKTLSGKFLYKNESIYPSDVLEGKKLDCDYVAWFNR